ncbi:hypothetical protein M0657_004861 [Pyricularia oryzae]|nr:hypothetical protein M9X92_008214 [Pyricularia oryzae]KAI7924022.1 hypothetical protein M0657_004861 [Pyricularia oryzae]
MSESNESPLPISGGTPITQESLRSRGLAPLLDEVDLLHSPTARGYSRVIRERFGGGETEARSWSILSTNATPEQRTHLHWILKSRIIGVRLISMAMTGFFYQMSRPRTSTPLSMLKYDPIGANELLLHHNLPSPSSLPATGPDLQSLTIVATRLSETAVRRKVLFLEQKRKSSK